VRCSICGVNSNAEICCDCTIAMSGIYTKAETDDHSEIINLAFKYANHPHCKFYAQNKIAAVSGFTAGFKIGFREASRRLESTPTITVTAGDSELYDKGGYGEWT